MATIAPIAEQAPQAMPPSVFWQKIAPIQKIASDIFLWAIPLIFAAVPIAIFYFSIPALSACAIGAGAVATSLALTILFVPVPAQGTPAAGVTSLFFPPPPPLVRLPQASVQPHRGAWRDIPGINWEAAPVGIPREGNDCCFLSAFQFMMADPDDAKDFYDDLVGLQRAYLARNDQTNPGIVNALKIVTDALEFTRGFLDHRTRGIAYPGRSSILRSLLPLFVQNQEGSSTWSVQMDAAEIAGYFFAPPPIDKPSKATPLMQRTFVELTPNLLLPAPSPEVRNQNNTRILTKEGKDCYEVEIPGSKVLTFPLTSLDFKGVFDSYFSEPAPDELQETKGYKDEDESTVVHAYKIGRKERFFTEAPSSLVCTFVRYNNQGQKIDAPIKDIPVGDFYIRFKENTLVGQPTETQVTYNLQSFICHIGGANGGHYINYIRQGDQWFRVDDDRRSEPKSKEEIAQLLNPKKSKENQLAFFAFPSESVYLLRFNTKA